MIFENVDQKFERLGFKKIEENKHGVWYNRTNDEFEYVQEIAIAYKANGKHIIQSYQKDVNPDGFNNMAAITYPEMRLIMKKYKQMKRRYKWG